MHVAIIGSGPSGIFAAKELLDAAPDCRVDVYDRLPTPFGLVRYGVAPDHPKIKSVTTALAAVMEDNRVAFFGNVEVGSDVSVDDLRSAYDGVLFATGAPNARRLDIPGEDLRGSVSAADFVAWYNGHPDRRPATDLLDARRVAVVGAGNVTLDVARVLLKGAKGLATTDIPDDVVASLEAVDEVHIVIRRGVTDVKFSYAELIELEKLEDVEISVRARDVELGEAAQARYESSRAVARVVDIFKRWAETSPDTSRAKRLCFRFGSSPVHIAGSERVEAVHLATTDGRRTDVVPVDAIVRSVGYAGRPMRGLPWDQDRAIIPNVDGRVSPNIYVAGWVKRGPSGIIGTNKPCAAESVKGLLVDLATQPNAEGTVDPRSDRRDAKRAEVHRTLAELGVHVDWAGWRRIDAAEQLLGTSQGRERTKIPSRRDLLAAAQNPSERTNHQ